MWHIPGTSSISGDVHGIGGWGKKLQQLLGAGLRPEVQEMLEGAQHVAVLQRNTADVDGHSLDIRVLNLFQVGDGRLRRLDTFFSDQAAAERFWNEVLPAE